ncbi:sugar-binding transcriptional regulator [Acidipropionibacterium timonense]|uniref:sugar-binding transcriptional regulator n=1 Tax=Acidipropionibacterium timonense TaxID=2161818 RepID=UPI0010321CB4|nr:sugar-binding domain-containing protein [Acidipropionibacterium timonense]
MDDRDHIKLLIEVARRYWIDGLGQAQIAAEIGYSRSMISRLLDEARRRRIVTITVSHPVERAMELETELCRRFHLSSARVATTSTSVDPSEAISLGAEVLLEVLPRDGVIAVTNGRTVSAVVNAVDTRRRQATVAQAMGGIAQGNHLVDAPEICRQLADRLACGYCIMPAPLLVGSESLAIALRHDPTISMTLTMASHADVLLTGIGSTSTGQDGAIFDYFVSPEEHQDFLDRGAVGHICGHHVDARGRHVDSEFCRRLMAVPHDRLPAISHVVAVAWGEHKAAAIRAAARGGLVDHLVTDMPTAQLVLA